MTLGAAVAARRHDGDGLLHRNAGRAGCGIFAGELLIVDPGGWNQTTLVGSEETVKVLSVNTGTNLITITSSIDSTGTPIQNSFVNAHLSGVRVRALGGFASGIVPPATSGFTNGSTPSMLKLYGDVNGDGSMVYVEYSCDPLPGARAICIAT